MANSTWRRRVMLLGLLLLSCQGSPAPDTATQSLKKRPDARSLVRGEVHASPRRGGLRGVVGWGHTLWFADAHGWIGALTFARSLSLRGEGKATSSLDQVWVENAAGIRGDGSTLVFASRGVVAARVEVVGGSFLFHRPEALSAGLAHVEGSGQRLLFNGSGAMGTTIGVTERKALACECRDMVLNDRDDQPFFGEGPLAFDSEFECEEELDLGLANQVTLGSQAARADAQKFCQSNYECVDSHCPHKFTLFPENRPPHCRCAHQLTKTGPGYWFVDCQLYFGDCCCEPDDMPDASVDTGTGGAGGLGQGGQGGANDASAGSAGSGSGGAGGTLSTGGQSGAAGGDGGAAGA